MQIILPQWAILKPELTLGTWQNVEINGATIHVFPLENVFAADTEIKFKVLDDPNGQPWALRCYISKEPLDTPIGGTKNDIKTQKSRDAAFFILRDSLTLAEDQTSYGLYERFFDLPVTTPDDANVWLMIENLENKTKTYRIVADLHENDLP